MFVAAAVALALQSMVRVDQFDLKNDFISEGDRILGLKPPRLVTNEHVMWFQWSNDGRNLLFTRGTFERSIPELLMNAGSLNAPEGGDFDEAACSYNVQTRTVSTLIELPKGGPRIEDVEWLMGSLQAVVVLSQKGQSEGQAHYSIERVSPDSRPVLLDSADGPVDEKPYLVMSPVQPEGFLEINTGGPTVFKCFTDQTPPIQVKHDRIAPAFDTSGHLVAVYRDPSTKTLHRLPVDAKTGEVGSSEVKSYSYPSRIMEVVPRQIPTGTGGEVPAMFLRRPDEESKQSGREALVATQCNQAELAWSDDEVAYVAQGSLFVRDIVPVDLDAYKKAYAVFERRDAMNRAKQIGLAALMYANDNDDNYPTASGFPNQIDPYLKDPLMLQGFVYSLNGENENTVEQPATTIMGYIPVAGGQVNVYTDGHVKYIPSP
jgi:hypothetical protein